MLFAHSSCVASGLWVPAPGEKSEKSEKSEEAKEEEVYESVDDGADKADEGLEKKSDAGDGTAV